MGYRALELAELVDISRTLAVGAVELSCVLDTLSVMTHTAGDGPPREVLARAADDTQSAWRACVRAYTGCRDLARDLANPPTCPDRETDPDGIPTEPLW